MNALFDRRTLPGVMLVVIGVLLFGAQSFDITGAGVLVAIATVFLASYAATRTYGLLIPSMILGGLGVGVALQEAGYDPQGGLVVIGLAGGFLGVFVIDVLIAGNQNRWWPLIPAGILSVTGASQLVEGTVAEEVIARYWPVTLVIAGLAILISSLRSRTTSIRSGSPDAAA